MSASSPVTIPPALARHILTGLGEQGARWLASLARPGDVVLTVGAGDVDAAVPVLLEALA